MSTSHSLDLERALADCLKDLFDPQELLRMVSYMDRDLYHEITGRNLGLSALAAEVARMVCQRGLVENLLQVLYRERPGRRRDIDNVAGLWRSDAPSQSSYGQHGAGAPSAPSAPAGGAVQEVQLDLSQQDDLVDLLLVCNAISERSTRDIIVGRLDGIKQFIRRHDMPKADVSAIVGACADHPGGIATLVENTRRFEGNTRHMQAVEAFLASAAQR